MGHEAVWEVEQLRDDAQLVALLAGDVIVLDRLTRNCGQKSPVSRCDIAWRQPVLACELGQCEALIDRDYAIFKHLQQ